MFEAGDIVAEYVVETLLGAGSTADVYRVHRIDEYEPVALKLLHTDAFGLPRVRERFLREFTIASLLHHRHIAAVYAQGEVGLTFPGSALPRSTMWMVMQYIDGPQSSVLIPDAHAEPDVSAVVRTSKQMAAALDYAHSMDVLHRDVKPANIMLSANLQCAYLTDFGIAQLVDDMKPLARNGRVAGSIAYASPELLQAQQLSPATDLYALACTMFEWLTGDPPFPRGTPFAITYAHLHDPVPQLTSRRDWLPSGLDAVFAKALAKSPSRRYASCAEFVDIVARQLHDVPVPDAPVRRWRRWFQHR